MKHVTVKIRTLGNTISQRTITIPSQGEHRLDSLKKQLQVPTNDEHTLCCTTSTGDHLLKNDSELGNYYSFVLNDTCKRYDKRWL